MISAVWGLCDLAAIATESGADSLAAQGLRSFELRCEHFDLGWWSAYCVGENAVRVASIQYHGMHIAIMGCISPNCARLKSGLVQD
jgi:hypothetical protein